MSNGGKPSGTASTGEPRESLGLHALDRQHRIRIGPRRALQAQILPILWDKPCRVEGANRRPDLQATFDEARLGDDLGWLHKYMRLGMSALMKRYDTDGEAKTTVTVIVDALTDQIVDRWATNRLPVAPAGLVKPWDDLVPAFEAPIAPPTAAPTQAICFSVAAARGDEMRAARRGAPAYYPGDERDWIPYPESTLTTTSQLALEAVHSLGVTCRWLDAKKELAKSIRVLETQGNTPVIILVDPWSLEVAALEQSLSEFDQNRFKNAMVIVACNPHEKPAEAFLPSPDRWATVEQKLRTVFGRSFPLNGESADFVSNIRDIDQLRQAVGTALKAMRGIVAIEKPAARKVGSTDGVPMNQN